MAKKSKVAMAETFRVEDVSTHRQKCSRIKLNGNRCGNWPRRGTTVCGFHGGKAPQVLAKAERQLEAKRDQLMAWLLEIAGDETQTTRHRLDAIKWGLERAGFRTGMAVEFAVPEWQQMLKGMWEEGAQALPGGDRAALEGTDDGAENLRIVRELGQLPPEPRWNDYGATSPDPAVIEGQARATTEADYRQERIRRAEAEARRGARLRR